MNTAIHLTGRRALALLVVLAAAVAVTITGATPASAGRVGSAVVGGISWGTVAGEAAHRGHNLSWQLVGGTGTADRPYVARDNVTTVQNSSDAGRGMGTVLTLRKPPPLPPSASGTATFLWQVSGEPGYHYRMDHVHARNGVEGMVQEVGVYQHGDPLGSFRVPWATDARGRQLATSFSLQQIDEAPGGRAMLTQTVDLRGAVYPVRVDPNFTWGIVSGSVYLNAVETSLLASNSTVFIGGLCSSVAIVGGAPGAAVCALDIGSLVIAAGAAKGYGECLQLTYYFGLGTLYADPYTGSWCTG